MNNKRTNYIVAILNAIKVISFFILFFSVKYLLSTMMSATGMVSESIFMSHSTDFLLTKIQIITPVVYGGIGIINIICAIQNRKNKKLCFWQLVFGILGVYTSIETIITTFLNIKNFVFIDWIDRILYGVIPIVLAIRNLVLIRKNKPKKIQVVSYIAVIIVSILILLGIINSYWEIVAVIMQFIYIHSQEKYVEETKKQKITNIMLYYVIQPLLTFSFLLIIITSLISSKIGEIQYKNQLSEIYNNIPKLTQISNDELYIPVEKDYKYGFIDENGVEKIACEYDRVSYFYKGEINNMKCHFAFANKGDNYYVISKSNQKIDISENKYLKNIIGYFGNAATSKSLNKNLNERYGNNKDYRSGYLYDFSNYWMLFSAGKLNEIRAEKQTQEKKENNEITLEKQGTQYYYKSNNYTMSLISMETEEDSYEYDRDDYDDSLDDDKKFNVIIKKNTGEENSYIEYIPYFNEKNNTIPTFSDGSIEFESIDKKRCGWYDINGNKTSLSADYDIVDVNDRHIILSYNKDENVYKNFILDKTGKTLMRIENISIFDNFYLIKSENKKISLYDKNLNKISNEYDKIILNENIDLTEQFSSYF